MADEPPHYSELDDKSGYSNQQPYAAPQQGYTNQPYGAPQYGAPQYGAPQQYAAPQQGFTPPQYGSPPYGAPQPGYAPQSNTTNTIVYTQPAVTVMQQYRESPVQTTCQFCHAQIITSTRYEAGNLAWIICVVLCFIGLGAGCCLIPFCVDGCKDVLHSCPNCRQPISRYSRM